MDRSLVQLTLVRLREFIRHPEAVFWTFGFPILLAVGLGVAFRAREPERPRVAVMNTGPAAAAIVNSLQRDSSLAGELLGDSAAVRALRTAKVALLVVPGAGGAVRYDDDPLREESGTARLLADRAIQVGAGRVDPVMVAERRVTEVGSRYIDFVGARPARHESHGERNLGARVHDSRCAGEKLLKRFWCVSTLLMISTGSMRRTSNQA